MVSSSCFFNCQDAGFVPNGNTNATISEGMNGAEVEQRLNQSVSFHFEYYGYRIIIW